VINGHYVNVEWQADRDGLRAGYESAVFVRDVRREPAADADVCDCGRVACEWNH
jgi:hypothetical protein